MESMPCGRFRGAGCCTDASARRQGPPRLTSRRLPTQLEYQQQTGSVEDKLTNPTEPVVHLYRYPGLSTSAASTLLRKVRAFTYLCYRIQSCHNCGDACQRQSNAPASTSYQHAPPNGWLTHHATCAAQAQSKVSDAITSIDAETCFNINLSVPLTAKEADTLAW